MAETEIRLRKETAKLNLDRQCPILITNNSHLSDPLFFHCILPFRYGGVYYVLYTALLILVH
jgi:hypothetical protein